MGNEREEPRSWREMTRWIREMLLERTGQDVAAWNARIAEHGFSDEASLRRWLSERGVTGYPRMLLVMERFGYPGYLTASPDELVEAQYRDRPALRPMLDAILATLPELGEVTVQHRKSYVALRTPLRTFASVEPRTKSRVDLGLRLPKDLPRDDRLVRATSMGQSAVTHRIGLASVEDVDDAVRGWLRRAYDENVSGCARNDTPRRHRSRKR